VVDEEPSDEVTVYVTLAVAPAPTLSVSVADDIAAVPYEFVRVMDAAESLAYTVKVTDSVEPDTDIVYAVVPDKNGVLSTPTLGDTESSVDVDDKPTTARPSAVATPPMSAFELARNNLSAVLS